MDFSLSPTIQSIFPSHQMYNLNSYKYSATIICQKVEMKFEVCSPMVTKVTMTSNMANRQNCKQIKEQFFDNGFKV